MAQGPGWLVMAIKEDWPAPLGYDDYEENKYKSCLDESSEKPNTPHHKVWGALRETLGKAGEVAGEPVRITQVAVGKIQRKLGEDYYAILEENPLVLDTLSRSDLLVENNDLLSTAFNVPWMTTLFWSAAAGSAIVLQRPIAQVLGKVFLYAPGHIKRWDEINKFMDNAVGVGHRLKFRHSIEYLPQIVEKFGSEGVTWRTGCNNASFRVMEL
jgi:hypothetical protein